ncbi:3'-5' exoribonuclease YhaM family protein [Alienimonas californiensis]|uniref:3'-5' exoribonuclease YhaM n=1 Tax=Alienimonas californiensis TaxID=2527989 RepID=A0A517P7Z8_9PLAN|nr:HD domain-containing protein [Alienimonas californiensis]QDT15501.1 3'-5' exoribonuclease YhaM [Alienimonas californiensis]
MLFPETVSKLSDLTPGATADVFALLSSKKQDVTKTGKPFYKCTFRDAAREASVMVWSDSGHFADCEANWKKGTFYKLRGTYEEGNYGPQLSLDKIRPVLPADADAGFDEADFFETSRFDADKMFRALTTLCEEKIESAPLRAVVFKILNDRAEAFKKWPAASRNHHAFAGGLLEHTLSVVRTTVWLCEKYAGLYPNLAPPLCTDAAIAGATLHDVGKLEELDGSPAGADYTPTGRLLGHILIGRDWLREAAAWQADQPAGPVDAELLLRTEHIVVSHHGIREFGSPAEPHTPEALIVQHADDLDAKFSMLADSLTQATGEGSFTPFSKTFGKPIFRGLSGTA